MNPYINYHPPYFFPETTTDSKGRQRRIHCYKDMIIPYDKLKSLPDAEQYLKPEVSFEILDKYALKTSDNKAASELQKARKKLFSLILKLPETG